jgi:hypothetical protein
MPGAPTCHKQQSSCHGKALLLPMLLIPRSLLCCMQVGAAGDWGSTTAQPTCAWQGRGTHPSATGHRRRSSTSTSTTTSSSRRACRRGWRARCQTQCCGLLVPRGLALAGAQQSKGLRHVGWLECFGQPVLCAGGDCLRLLGACRTVPWLLTEVCSLSRMHSVSRKGHCHALWQMSAGPALQEDGCMQWLMSFKAPVLWPRPHICD